MSAEKFSPSGPTLAGFPTTYKELSREGLSEKFVEKPITHKYTFRVGTIADVDRHENPCERVLAEIQPILSALGELPKITRSHAWLLLCFDNCLTPSTESEYVTVQFSASERLCSAAVVNLKPNSNASNDLVKLYMAYAEGTLNSLKQNSVGYISDSISWTTRLNKAMNSPSTKDTGPIDAVTAVYCGLSIEFLSDRITVKKISGKFLEAELWALSLLGLIAAPVNKNAWGVTMMPNDSVFYLTGFNLPYSEFTLAWDMCVKWGHIVQFPPITRTRGGFARLYRRGEQLPAEGTLNWANSELSEYAFI